MYNQTGVGTLVAIIGFIALFDPGVADAQIEGAVQYPPPSIGADAQPPPPAGMVPKIVSPRRLELGASQSSLVLINPPYRNYQEGDPFPMRPVPVGGDAWSPRLPTERGND
jgi:hypothetical protein